MAYNPWTDPEEVKKRHEEQQRQMAALSARRGGARVFEDDPELPGFSYPGYERVQYYASGENATPRPPDIAPVPVKIGPVPTTSPTTQKSQFTPLIGDYTPPPIVGPPPEPAVAGPPHIPAQEIAQAWENLYYDFPSDGLKNRVLEAQEWAKRKKREWEW